MLRGAVEGLSLTIHGDTENAADPLLAGAISTVHRLALASEAAASLLAEHPDPLVRRAAALLAAAAHPPRAGLESSGRAA